MTESQSIGYKIFAILAALAVVLGTVVAARTAFDAGSAASVDWVSPTEGATLSGTFTLQADAPAETAKVGFFLEQEGKDVWLGNDKDGAPWEGSFDTTHLADGAHKLRIAARDGSGNVLGRKTITVTIANSGAAESTPAPAPTNEPATNSEPTPAPTEEAASPAPTPAPTEQQNTSTEPVAAPQQEAAAGDCEAQHAQYAGWHPPVVGNCQFGHEHGDDADPYGFFKQAGAPELNFQALHDLVKNHHDGHSEAHSGNKVIYMDGGTPDDPSDDIRTTYHQISVGRNTAPFYEKYVRDRDPRWEPYKFHSAQVQMLGKGGDGNLTFTDVKWVDKVGDMHPHKSADRMPSPQEERELVERFKRDPAGTVQYIRDNVGKESWYWIDYIGGDGKKEGLELPLWNYELTDRILDAPTYIDESRTGDARLQDLWTCEKNGFELTDDACGTDGTLRMIDKFAFRVMADKPGVYWTDVYGKKVYGTGENQPQADVPLVKQVIGVVDNRQYIGNKGLNGNERLKSYDAPGIVPPN